MKGLYELQLEHKTWVEHNFPKRNKVDALLGITEELGELFVAYKRNSEGLIVDAIGDMVIYTLSFCNTNDIDLKYALGITIMSEGGTTIQVLNSLVEIVGQLNHVFLKTKQKIRITQEESEHQTNILIAKLITALTKLCMYKGHNFIELVNNVWSEVSKRDWIKYPKTGLPEVSEEVISVETGVQDAVAPQA